MLNTASITKSLIDLLSLSVTRTTHNVFKMSLRCYQVTAWWLLTSSVSNTVLPINRNGAVKRFLS